jgi:hypothetical protein
MVGIEATNSAVMWVGHPNWRDYTKWVYQDYKGFAGIEGEKRMVTVYQVFIIDRAKEEFIDKQTVMGETTADAMLNVELTPAMRKLKSQDKLAIITKDVGSFEKYEVQEVRIKNEESDD